MKYFVLKMGNHYYKRRINPFEWEFAPTVQKAAWFERREDCERAQAIIGGFIISLEVTVNDDQDITD